MKAFLTIVILICIYGHAAWAIQTCPAGNPRIAPDSRYTDNLNGTITDNQTGLMWKQCLEGQSGVSCTGSATPMTWQSALVVGANSNFAGFNDWRLPDVKEARSLVETACFGPAINELRFPNTSNNGLWTASSAPAYVSQAWYVGFYVGNVSSSFMSDGFSVRLVRGAQ